MSKRKGDVQVSDFIVSHLSLCGQDGLKLSSTVRCLAARVGAGSCLELAGSRWVGSSQ